MLKLNPYFFVGFMINILMLPMVFSVSLQGLSFVYPLLLVFIFIFKNDNPKINLPYVFLFLIFATLYVATSLTSPAQIYDFTFYKVFFFLIKCVSMFFIGMLVSQHTESFIKGYIISLFIMFFVYCIYTIFLFRSGVTLSVNNRIEIGDSNPIWVSRYVLECLIFFIAIFGCRSIKTNVVGLCSFIISFLSGSKGPLLAFLVTQFLTSSLKNKIFISISIIFISIMSYYLFISFLPQELISFIEQRFFRLVPDGASEQFVKESRDVVWLRVIEMSFSNANNFLFGYGVGESYQLLGASPARYYPHNIFFELLFENGFICMFLFSIIIVLAFVNCNLFTGLMFFHIINALFSGDILLNEKIFLFIGLSLFSPNHIKVFLNGKNCKF
ncbi:hypothetical protein GIS01_06845 [Aeromonas veronii]|nr:hypothetical protein GIS01_06845 [Aeromonas veronii]